MEKPVALFVLVITALILWPLNVHAQKIELVVETGHYGKVFTVRFSRDGRLLMSVGAGGGTKLWSVESGKQLRTLPDPGGMSFNIAENLEHRIVAGTEFLGKVITLRNIGDGTEVRTLTSESVVVAVAVGVDGNTLASGHEDNTVRIWDISKGVERQRLPNFSRRIRDLVFTPDGKSLLSLDDGSNLLRWDVATYAAPLPLKLKEPLALSNSLAVSPDGKTLAALGGDWIQLWDLTTGQALAPLPRAGDLYPFTFSKDGQAIISGDDIGIVFRDIATGKTVRTLKPEGRVESLDISLGGALLASGNDLGVIRVWDLASEGKYSDLVGHAESLQPSGLSPDGRTVIARIEGKPDRFFDVQAGDRFITSRRDSEVSGITRSPAESLYAASVGSALKLFDTSGRELRMLARGAAIRSLAFSPDGRLLAGNSYGGEGTVRLWDVATGTELPALTAGPSGAEPYAQIAFSPDGKILAGLAPQSLKLWDVATRKALATVTVKVENSFISFAFSPDRKTFATMHYHREINVWEVSSGRKLQTYTLGSYLGRMISFGPDGRLLASGADEYLIKIWDVVSNKELASMSVLDESDWAVVTPEGRFDASPGGMRLMHYSYGEEAIDLQQLKERYYEPGLLAKVVGFNREPMREVVEFRGVELFPTAEVVGPLDGKLSVKLVNRGGGIGPVQVFVNDKEFVGDARPKDFDPTAKQATLELDLRSAPVVAGKANRVRIVTYNGEAYLSSRGTLLSWEPPVAATAVEEIPRLYAIVAGISDYSSPQLKLHYAAKDAADIARAFQLGGRGLFGADRVQVKLLSSDRSNPLATPPTKANFRKAFEELRGARDTDVLVIYFSGHGVTLPGSNTYLYLTQEARSKESSALSDPAVREQTAISSNELVEWIRKIPALKQVMILDTCAAGAAASKLVEKRGVTGDQIRAIERLKDRTGFHILMGSAADAVSYEATQYGQGILTYILLQGMSGAALRDDQFVDVQKLFQYVADGVPQLAKNVGGVQKPVVAAPGGTSFDVGRLSAEDKSLIPLSKVKPLVLRPRITLQELGDDTLYLMREMRQRLRDASYFSETDVSPPKFVYVDEEDLPGAIRLVGTYTVTGETVKIKLFLRRDDQTIRPLPTVEGSSRDVPALAGKVFDLLMKALDDVATL
jgi:WD40 repeat protein